MGLKELPPSSSLVLHLSAPLPSSPTFASLSLSCPGSRRLLSQPVPLGPYRTFLLKHILTQAILLWMNYATGSNLQGINQPATPGNCLLMARNGETMAFCDSVDKGL